MSPAQREAIIRLRQAEPVEPWRPDWHDSAKFVAGMLLAYLAFVALLVQR